MRESSIRKSSGTPVVPTSDYIRKSAVFYKNKRAPLLVLVEGDDDVPFWKKLFSCIKDVYPQVDIHTLKSASENVLRQYDKDGKPMTAPGKEPLMKIEGLGKNKVVAVDADYDLLIDYHTYSQRFRQDPFVISTQYYSIENHLFCNGYLPNLSILKKVNFQDSNDELSTILNDLGETVMDAVKLSIVSTKSREKSHRVNQTPENLPDILTCKEIATGLSSIPFCNCSDYRKKLSLWKNRFENSQKFKSLSEKYMQDLLNYNDWSSQDALHYLQGHTLYACISKVIISFFKSAMKDMEKSVRKNTQNSSGKSKSITNFHSDIGFKPEMNYNDYVKSSIYSADFLDMNNADILTIQKDIKQIATI